MGIFRTIPKTESKEWLQREFFNNSKKGRKDFFPFGRVVRKANKGDFLYLVYKGYVFGRLCIQRIDQKPGILHVGSKSHQVRAKTVIWVDCPGELAPGKYRWRSLHGFTYGDVADWGKKS